MEEEIMLDRAAWTPLALAPLWLAFALTSRGLLLCQGRGPLLRRTGLAERPLALATIRSAACRRPVLSPALNLLQLESILELAASLGVHSVLLNRMNIGGLRPRHWRELWLEPAEVDALLVTADRVGGRLGLRISSGVCTRLCAVDPEAHPDLRTPTCSPEAERRPLTLDGWGDLRSCNHSPVILGDLHRQHLTEILDSTELARWRDVIPDFCAECERWADCLGGCRAACEQLGAGLHRVDPLLWPHEELQRTLETGQRPPSGA